MEAGDNAYGSVQQLYLLKKANRHVKVLLSIGGWTWSTNFAVVASTETGRRQFASSAVGLIKDWGMDGIDVDWEYPKDAAETGNMILLLKEVRTKLEEYAADTSPGYHFLLTVATSASPSIYQIMRLGELGAIVDYIYIMAYDYTGSWGSNSGHQANLRPSEDNGASTPFSTEQAVDYYLNAGVPPGKIVLGIPLYGRTFQNTTGPGRPFSGIGN
ncbi:hypothetical protein MCOR05_011713 [Pyricularia oryzae]|nr:hypothetical protein MCOR05_011713 [Pyricularia oryzae]